MKWNYKDLIELGFEKISVTDRAYLNKYGYECFRLELNLSDTKLLIWHPEDRALNLLTMDKEGTILNTLNLETKEQVNMFLEVFLKKKEMKKQRTWINFTHAA